MDVTIPVALIAGFVSFVSPCFLPIVPAFVGQLVGSSDTRVSNRHAFLNAVGFVAGFSMVFILIWASIGLIGNVLGSYTWIFRILGGAILILMGLHIARLINIPFLDRVVRAPVKHTSRPKAGRACLLGVIFGAGWTPCVGPVLGAILALASTSDTLWRGLALMIAYCLGLGVPIVLVAISSVSVAERFGWFSRHQVLVSLISGGLMIVVGLLMLTGLFTILSGLLPAIG